MNCVHLWGEPLGTVECLWCGQRQPTPPPAPEQREAATCTHLWGVFPAGCERCGEAHPDDPRADDLAGELPEQRGGEAPPRIWVDEPRHGATSSVYVEEEAPSPRAVPYVRAADLADLRARLAAETAKAENEKEHRIVAVMALRKQGSCIRCGILNRRGEEPYPSLCVTCGNDMAHEFECGPKLAAVTKERDEARRLAEAIDDAVDTSRRWYHDSTQWESEDDTAEIWQAIQNRFTWKRGG